MPRSPVSRPGATATPSEVDGASEGAADSASEYGVRRGRLRPSSTAGPVDAPTEAGLPIFGADGDDVSWLERRTTPVPPPPPFDEPPERPLFAPEPSNGAPRRTPREGLAPASGITPGDEFWPFAGRADASGRQPVVLAPTPGGPVPGRSWNRLASGIAVVVLLLVAVIVAINLGRGKTPLGTEPDDDPSSSASESAPAGQALRGIEAAALDPLGTDAGEENNQDAPLGRRRRPRNCVGHRGLQRAARSGRAQERCRSLPRPRRRPHRHRRRPHPAGPAHRCLDLLLPSAAGRTSRTSGC